MIPPVAPDAGPPRREHPLLRRSPLWAAPALLLCGWLLWDSWPDVAWAFAPREPIDLGGPGAYHPERAVPNRLARVAGLPAAAVGVQEARGGEERTVIGLRGLALAVDRAGRGGATAVYEGRLLPAARAGAYAGAVAALRGRGWEAGERWLVLRDGERPGARWGPVAWSAILLALAALNARALLKGLWG